MTYAIETVRELLGYRPIFGICLGIQLLGIAMGGKTYKLKFGHRGANQPVKNLSTGRVEITSQNHGFAVAIESLKDKDIEVTHINLNDDSIEGIELIDIKTSPIKSRELEELKELAGSYEALFSKRARLYKVRGLNKKQLSEDQYEELILEHYTFLKRPVMLIKGKIFIGNSLKVVASAKETIHS